MINPVKIIILTLLFAWGLFQQPIQALGSGPIVRDSGKEISSAHQQQTKTQQQNPNPAATGNKPSTPTNPADQQSKSDEKSEVRVTDIPPITLIRDKPAFVISVVLGLVGLIGVAISIGTLILTRRQFLLAEKAAQAAKISADAGTAAVTQAKDTAQRELRAYLLLSGSQIIFMPVQQPTAQVVIKNYGQTPAYKVQQWVGFSVGRYPLGGPLRDPRSFEPAYSESILGPGGQQTNTISSQIPFTQAMVDRLGTPEVTIYIYGIILYEDIFGAAHETKFRLIFGGPKGPQTAHDNAGTLIGLLGADSEGNEAT